MGKKKSIDVEALSDEKTLKLDYKQTFRVGLAFATICLFWQAYDFVVPLLLEDAYGLSNTLRGLIMGLDNLLSLFMLPLFGKLSDKANGKFAKKFGRRTPFIVVGTLCAIVLMVFVPVATLNQQKRADAEISKIEVQLNDDAFMATTLAEFYDSGNKNYCDHKYLADNGITREMFIAMRYDDNLQSKGGLMGIGSKLYYGDTEVTDINAVEPVSGKTYKEIQEANADYNKYAATGMNNYISDQVFQNVTKTAAGTRSLAVYMVILLLVLVSMATFRSPAVALMPDVTPKPLRSQANAIINLMGGIGGAIAFLIYTVVLFGERLSNYVIIFGASAGGMLLLLAGFLALVNERKMVAKCQEICKEYGIDDFDEEDIEATKFAEELIAEGEGNLEEAERLNREVLEIAKAKAAKRKSLKDWWNSKSDGEKAKLKSFWLILASIFMWFIGYNAVTSNLSIYITKELNLSAGIASIISGVSMAISAIAFIPVGYLAAKIGRKKTIIIGFALAIVSFILIFAVVRAGMGNSNLVPSALFALFYLLAGFGLIIANVNTFPMVTELSTSETVGQYTGYYYVATMSAQAITPALAGLVMDNISNRGLFVYSAIAIGIAILCMAFVKHGDSKPIPKKSKLEQFGDVDAD